MLSLHRLVDELESLKVNNWQSSLGCSQLKYDIKKFKGRLT